MATLIQTSAPHISYKTTADISLSKVAIVQWQQDRVNKLDWTNHGLRDRHTLLIDHTRTLTHTHYHHWKEVIIFFVLRFVRNVSRGYKFLITLDGYFMFVNVFVKNKSSESSPLENPTICFDKKKIPSICFHVR